MVPNLLGKYIQVEGKDILQHGGGFTYGRSEVRVGIALERGEIKSSEQILRLLIDICHISIKWLPKPNLAKRFMIGL